MEDLSELFLLNLTFFICYETIYESRLVWIESHRNEYDETQVLRELRFLVIVLKYRFAREYYRVQLIAVVSEYEAHHKRKR